MTLSFADVRGWNSAPLQVGSTVVSTLTGRLRQVAQGLVASGFGAGTGSQGWSGAAADAAEERHGEGLLRLLRLVEAVSALDDAVRAASWRVESVQGLADQALRCAQAAGGALDESGRFQGFGTLAGPTTGVGAGHHGPTSRPDGTAGSDLRDVAETLAARAVAEAGLADELLVSALRDLGAALLLHREGEGGSPLAPAPPGSPVDSLLSGEPGVGALTLIAAGSAGAGSPQLSSAAAARTPRAGGDASLAWWRSLGAAEQREAVVSRPDVVGRADGIPAWARDRANRILLAQARRRLSDEADRLAARRRTAGAMLSVDPWGGAATVGTLDGPTDRAAYLRVQGQLAAVDSVENVLAASDGRARQLLVFDLSGPSPRAAVAVGDVDRAQHVAVVVPGFTTTVAGDLAGSDRLSADLADLARREAMGWGDRGDVAVVSWLGYDAPQVADTLRARSVAFEASARAGSDALAPFLGGMPEGAHLTVVAHSYGSTTAGLAVARGGTGVDDLVAIGSPGLGVSSVAALGLAPPRVHVLEATDDVVADLGRFGRDPSRLPGVDRPSTQATVLPDGSAGRASVGHSTYLSPGTTSQWNIAAIVAGLPATAGPLRGTTRSW